MPQLRKRLIALLSIVLVPTAMSGCGPGERGPVKVIVIGERSEPADPSKGALDAGQAILLANTAQGLVRFDARGQIVPGLAERWTVTDDGLSYIFRLAAEEWPDGSRLTAQQVARILRQQVSAASKNELRGSLGAIDEIVAMTDRVIEIRLRAPRPNLLQILAQPEFTVFREGGGTGPFLPASETGDEDWLRLIEPEPANEDDPQERDEVLLRFADAPAAVRSFIAGDADLVLGGTFVSLPYARAENVPNGALNFDPASGLFGLLPRRETELLANPDVRRLLSEAIDRDALIAAFNVPGLLSRATILEPGLDIPGDPVPPEWTAAPIAQRRESLLARAQRLLIELEIESPALSIALPEGPGSEIVFARLAADWRFLGIEVTRAEAESRADLVLVDRVAPSTSPAWFLRTFHCDNIAVCSAEADELLEAARAAPVAAQRYAFLNEAARIMDEEQLFIPLTAPIRWSLVADRTQGFAGNRFALHTLIGLRERLDRERAE